MAHRPPSSPEYFNSFTQKNRTFNPSIGVNTTITAGTALPGTWTTTIVDSGGMAVRTFSGSTLPETVVWDGKNNSGTDQPDGTYSYRLASISTTGDIATGAQGPTILDRTKQLTISNIAVSQPFFSPNGDGVQDTTTLTGTNSFDDTTLTVNVKDSGGSVVRTATSSGTNLAYTWDGTNTSAVMQPDGVYTFEVAAVNGTASATSSISASLDNTPPTGAFTAPADGQVLSNVYTNGVTNVTVTGSAGDLNFKNWSLDYGSGGAPTSFTALGSGTSAVTNVTMGTWATASLANGLYTLRLQAWDKAGNRSVISIRPTLGNFSASQAGLQLNASNGNTVTYTSIVPFNLTETITLRNAGGQLVRTLVNAVRSAGTFADAWNGLNDSGMLLPDGPYFYMATVTDGTHTFTWDLTTQYLNNYSNYNDGLNIGSWDPFNNRPMTFTYNFAQPGQVSIGLTPITTGYVPNNCNPPNFCLAYNRYEESGPHTVTWAGVDGAGVLRSDIKRVGVVTQRYAFSKNAVLLFGTKPTVTNVTVTPPMFGPAVGAQTVAFDLASYQSQATDVTVSFLNQSSLSTLRTISLPAQPAGHRTMTWDGRAENGMWVAPGFYTVSVTATDSIGNQATGQILTTIIY